MGTQMRMDGAREKIIIRRRRISSGDVGCARESTMDGWTDEGCAFWLLLLLLLLCSGAAFCGCDDG